MDTQTNGRVRALRRLLTALERARGTRMRALGARSVSQLLVKLRSGEDLEDQDIERIANVIEGLTAQLLESDHAVTRMRQQPWRRV